jgi:hypothetical protein
MSEQVGTGRDMLVQIFGNRTDMSGQVGTGLDSSRQFWYSSGRVWTCRDMLDEVVTGPSMSGHVRSDHFRWGYVGTGCLVRSEQVWTGLVRSEQVVTCLYMIGLVGTCRYRSRYVFTGLSGRD